MTFEFFAFRFHFRAAGSLYFPPYKSGNLVRGAFGVIFRSLVCKPECRDAKTCDVRAECPYARIFEPQASRGEGPSGLSDWPRPFVFRAAHLDGRTIRSGEAFYFDVHLFDVHEPGVAYFVAAFAQLAHEGLGPGRGRAELIAVEQLDLTGSTQRIFEGGRFRTPESLAPSTVELNAAAVTPVTRGKIQFVTPIELKSEQQVVRRPEFGLLFGRLRDRVSNLRALYGPGPLDIDFRAMGERAAMVRLTRCEWNYVDAERLSSRSGQRHSLGGFVGEAEYEGDLGEFVPYLQVGHWVGVGRQTVWGKGAILWEPMQAQ